MSFNINQHGVGEVKRAVLHNGKTVTRVDRIFIEAWGSFNECAAYDNHFIYENPDTRKNTPGLLCTCGSVAVVAPAGATGMIVCLFDLNTGLLGHHASDLYNSKDIDKLQGKKLDMDGLRKELI